MMSGAIVANDRHKPVELEVDDVLAVTDSAVLCEIDGDEYWLPWSQISDAEIADKGDSGTIVIPRWLAEKHGLD